MDESVRVVAKNLLQRAEEYKSSVEGIIKRYNERLQQTEGELKDILDQLDKQQNLNKEAVGIIAKVNEEIKSLETENCTLEESLSDLKSELIITKGKLQEVEVTRSTLEQELEMEKESNTALAHKFREAHEKIAEIEKLTHKVSSLEQQNQSYSKECQIYKEKVNETMRTIRRFIHEIQDFGIPKHTIREK
ncbi:uncharacterized protein [Onthophagus taurus]|uniref:uncharacterized protein n=1 Tax=Onthophagus taurus TaxID=166361 RepID=UPI0039BE5DCE